MNAKRLLIIMVAVSAIFTLGLSAVAAQGNPGNGNGGSPGNGNQGGGNTAAPRATNRGGGMYGGVYGGMHLRLPLASTDELPQDVVDLMIDGWTDEQHAYTVYSAVIDQFGAVRPFVNIQRSEAQHIAAWEILFARYDITIPEVPAFELSGFASLYEACAAGAEAEVANSDLYNAMMAGFEPYPDLLYVAQSLRGASEFSHLSAFEMCAGR